MKIEIRKAIQSDLDWIRENPLEKAVREYPYFTLKDYAYTGLVDGQIVGVGGVVIYWPGVGEGWIILSKEVLNFKVETYLCIKRLVEKAISDLHLRRLQATVRLDFPQAQKMIESLGFVCEGLMKSYLPDGTDCWLYARIIK